MRLNDAIRLAASFADAKATDIFGRIMIRDGELIAMGHGRVVVIECGDTEGIEGQVDAVRLARVAAALGPELRLEPRDHDDRSKTYLTLRVAKLKGKGHFDLSMSNLSTAPNVPAPPDDAAWYRTDRWGEIQRIAWCVCEDQSRKHLTGVALVGDHAEATDGHAGCKVMIGELINTDDGEVITPEELTGEPPLIRPTHIGDEDEVVITHHEGWLYILTADVTRGVRMVDTAGKWPGMELVLSEPRKTPALVVDTEKVQRVLTEAKVINTPLILHHVHGKALRVVTREESGVHDQYEGRIPVEREVEGTWERGNETGYMPNGCVMVDLKIFANAVNSMHGEHFELHMVPTDRGSLEPIMLIDEGCEIAVMPMRI